LFFFFFNDTATTEIYTLSLHDALPICTHWKQIAHSFAKPLLYAVTPQFEAQALNLQKNRPGTQVEVFREAGHALFVDEPVRFNALVRKFAETLAQR